ncbi:unnamed protein product [Nesidiocoris tenuis]|uniref:tRNA (cytosine(38)-C(5))-methyltransferase n=1 Tax=Nesidiocoris tenuis TaxID=355587 RepID=A0A6H5H045_9HEMI|nr:unnamed protein product [Nesidiocoris tenuis]
MVVRVGNKKDLDDKRSVPLAHILNILPELVNVRYILVENVTGFECSEAGDQLRATVAQCGFEFRELMISPLQLGVPNCRERYYMIAVRKPAKFLDEIPPRGELDSARIKELLGNVNARHKAPSRVSDILELPDNSDAYGDFLLPEDVLRKRAWILDIATKPSTRTCCFTKSYTHYVEGTGSVYCPFDEETIAKVYASTENMDQLSSEYLETLATLRLRFFTPREVQRTLCFPDWFDYPADVTRRQKYRLLGNSINVHVVSRLIQIMVNVIDS